MKTMTHSLRIAILGAGLFTVGCAKQQPSSWSLKNPETTQQLKSFVAEKEAQARASAKADGKKMLPEFKSFFAAAQSGDFRAVTNLFDDFRKRSPQYDHPPGAKYAYDERLRGNQWQTVLETWGAFDAFVEGDEKYSADFGNDIIQSIPPGSIYFGGTDPGRFLITAMQKSHVNGDPFFTLTQNALADGTYLQYLRSMYDGKIYTPTDEDSQKCFEDYVADAKQRLQNHQLKPGEDIKLDSKGLVQVSGQVAVMEINGLLVKTIFDKNTNHEFYIEESYPLDWMYPYLEPHGLIMKINRLPLVEMSDEIVQRDHDYWTKYTTPMIGDWLNDDTSVEKVAAFAKKTFGKQDFSGFAGDPRFIQNTYSHKTFSKLRSSLGGLYAWRMHHAADAAEKERMAHEADFAYRQAWALCPYSPEAVYRYVDFLLAQNRLADARLVAETAFEIAAPRNEWDAGQFHNLIDGLKNAAKSK